MREECGERACTSIEFVEYVAAVAFVDGTHEENVVHRFVGILTCWADRGVSTVNSEKRLVEWGVASM